MKKNRIEIFWSNVDKTGSCWNWMGYKNAQGYGSFRWIGGRRAHRCSYYIETGVITNKLVCHRCDNPSCVRPDHLFIGTYKDNSNDMVFKGRHPRHQAKKTHCSRGHNFSKENTYLYNNGWRMCRACNIKNSCNWQSRPHIRKILNERARNKYWLKKISSVKSELVELRDERKKMLENGKI